MSVTRSVSLSNRVVDDFAAIFRGGAIALYAGARPATPDDTAGSVALATIGLPSLPFGDADEKVAALAGQWQGTVYHSGAAAWFRASSADGAIALDGSIGLAGSGADMILADTDLVAGNLVRITAATVETI